MQKSTLLHGLKKFVILRIVTTNNMNIRYQVAQHFQYFRNLPGSKSIASLTALESLISLSVINPPKLILEYGTGIGTISSLLLNFTDCRIISIENRPEVHAIAIKNISYISGNFGKRFKIINGEYEIKANEWNLFDWIIIDGPVNIKKINLSESLVYIIVENQRLLTRLKIVTKLTWSKRRFSYGELDSSRETGVAFFYLNPRSKSNLLVYFDFLGVSLLLIPRLVRSIARSRGKILKVGKLLESE